MEIEIDMERKGAEIMKWIVECPYLVSCREYTVCTRNSVSDKIIISECFECIYSKTILI